eukprot:6662744-Pyramimonas_sp.AAC.1
MRKFSQNSSIVSIVVRSKNVVWNTCGPWRNTARKTSCGAGGHLLRGGWGMEVARARKSNAKSCRATKKDHPDRNLMERNHKRRS